MTTVSVVCAIVGILLSAIASMGSLCVVIWKGGQLVGRVDAGLEQLEKAVTRFEKVSDQIQEDRVRLGKIEVRIEQLESTTTASVRSLSDLVRQVSKHSGEMGASRARGSSPNIGGNDHD